MAIEADLLGETKALQCASAEGERALITERDEYRRRIELATDTRGWRASAAITRAHTHRITRLFGLIPQHGAYFARSDYHTAIPHRVRRDLWFRRHTYKSYRAYYRQLNAPARVPTSPEAVVAAQVAVDAECASIHLAVGPVTNSTGNEARVAVDYSDPVTEVNAFARCYTFDHDGESFDIPALAMFCVAMRQDVATEIGDLDKRFRYGIFEDDDYVVRMHRVGYRVVCAEDVFNHHAGSASLGKLGEDTYMRLFSANRSLFEEKRQMAWQSHKYREGYQP